MCTDDLTYKLHAILGKYGIAANRIDEICDEIYCKVVKEAYSAGFDDGSGPKIFNGNGPKTFWND